MEAAGRSLFPESSLPSPRKYEELRVGIFAYLQWLLGHLPSPELWCLTFHLFSNNTFKVPISDFSGNCSARGILPTAYEGFTGLGWEKESCQNNPAWKVTRVSLLPKCCYWGLININGTTKSVWHFTKTLFLSPPPLKMIMEIKAAEPIDHHLSGHNRMKKSWWQKINFVIIYPGAILFLLLLFTDK